MIIYPIFLEWKSNHKNLIKVPSSPQTKEKKSFNFLGFLSLSVRLEATTVTRLNNEKDGSDGVVLARTAWKVLSNPLFPGNFS